MGEYRYVLSGEVDLARVPMVRADLRRAINRNYGSLLVDCADVTFIDSAAVAALLEAHQRLSHQGRRMCVVNVSPAVRNAFHVLGVADLLAYRDRKPA